MSDAPYPGLIAPEVVLRDIRIVNPTSSLGRTLTRMALALGFAALLATSGCATKPAPQMRMAVAQPVSQMPLNCLVIADKSLCAPYAVTLELPSGNNTKDFNLADCILSNSVSLLGGMFQSATLTEPGNTTAQGDVLVSPRALEASGKADGNWAWHNCTFSTGVALTFLDSRRVPIFNLEGAGSVTSKTGNTFEMESRAAQRAYDAVFQAVAAAGAQASASEELALYLQHRTFFSLDDAAKRTAVERVYSPSEHGGRIGPMLLAYSIRGGDLQCAERLLESGVSPNAPSGSEGMLPAHWAALYNKADAISLLLAKGGCIDQRDRAGHLPIYYAAWNGLGEATAKLLRAGTPPDVFNPEDPVVSSVLIESFGDFYAQEWQPERARDCYEIARKNASAMAKRSEEALARIDRQWTLRFIGLVAASALVGTVQAAAGDFQARRNAQISALREANRSGTGITGYYQMMAKYNENHRPTDPRLAGIGVPLAFRDLAVSKSSHSGSKQGTDLILARVNRKLHALQQANDYDTFR